MYRAQWRNERGQVGHNSPAPNHYGGRRLVNNVTSTFFSTVYLLPKDLRFEHGALVLLLGPGAI